MHGLLTALVLTAAPSAPTDAECAPLPAQAAGRLPFQAGEKLDYEIDLLGGLKIGTVEFEVLPPERIGSELLLPIRAHAAGDGFVASIGKLESNATTWLRIHDLLPVRYREDYTERGGHYWTEVHFTQASPCRVQFAFGQPNGSGEKSFPCGSEALDLIGSFYLVRGLDLQVGQPMCFDLYGSRHVWRLWGTVAKRESVSTPAGTFQTLKLSGHAAWNGTKDKPIDLSIWMTDDARHLPVRSVAGFGFGPVKAALTGMGGAKRSENDR